MKVLYVLQNAWRNGAKPGERDWDGPTWLRALWRSQTGKRLREMIPDGIEYEVVNASPFVGSRAWNVFAADCVLMHSRMRRIRPDLVVLCGKVAQELAPVVGQYNTPHLDAPHPAWRRLSKAETADIRHRAEKMLRVLRHGAEDQRPDPRGL